MTKEYKKAALGCLITSGLFLLFALVIILLLTSCSATKQETQLPERPEISWEIFQKLKGCKSTKSHAELLNEYLDTWRGSAEEEKAFMDLGLELN
ncbi:MAG: hypothetical protein J1E16_04395 [Muribaculaceae bacterium]|nr:hypothetical protein [Muribaculaceae bacterium]